MKSSLKNIFITIIFILMPTNTVHADNSDKLYKKIDLFSEVLEKISEEYVEEIDPADVMDSAINGVLQSLDPYSAYMSPSVFENMQTETEGKFGGLGIRSWNGSWSC